MINYTTPTIVLTVEGVDLTDMDVYVTLEQGAHELTKTGEDLVVQEKTIGVYLTQDETLSLPNGYTYIQINWTYDGSKRMCSNLIPIKTNYNLLDRAVE